MPAEGGVKATFEQPLHRRKSFRGQSCPPGPGQGLAGIDHKTLSVNHEFLRPPKARCRNSDSFSSVAINQSTVQLRNKCLRKRDLKHFRMGLCTESNMFLLGTSKDSLNTPRLGHPEKHNPSNATKELGHRHWDGLQSSSVSGSVMVRRRK